ncbi:MAG: phosphoribosylaminoimidazolesuccinocarboxamide synthase [Candidatus Cloacimonadota bacterium]|nr:phosphoribosylaminoimidazolesuccinocarboxamide synthase [Candidatus Cloacimonadota bacterium]
MNANLNKLFPMKHGKVRDIYEIGDKLLLVTSDRISAFDFVLPNLIPDKGKLLNQISKFWFGKTKAIVDNHFITDKVEEFPEILHEFKNELEQRSMLVKKADKIHFECIVRGYITGSGWIDYQKNGTICEIKLPEHLQESERLPKPIFTPSTKAEVGHDENIGFQVMKNELGTELAEKIKKISLELYTFAHDFMSKKGIILADTKFEFGLINGELILIDEALTPDSSRFWQTSEYKIGHSQKSFDKQFIREYLLSKGIKKIKNIDENLNILNLPDEIIRKTVDKYFSAFKIITGENKL